MSAELLCPPKVPSAAESPGGGRKPGQFCGSRASVNICEHFHICELGCLSGPQGLLQREGKGRLEG